MSNPLKPIMAWYEAALDSIRVTRRVIEKEIDLAITEKHVFFDKTSNENLKILDDTSQEIDDLVVLALVATFERRIRDKVLELVAVGYGSTSAPDFAIKEQIGKDVEYWKMADELLAIFSDFVSVQLRGDAKQVINYRNWVAHGRKATNPPGAAVLPKTAFERLTAVLEAVGAV